MKNPNFTLAPLSAESRLAWPAPQAIIRLGLFYNILATPVSPMGFPLAGWLSANLWNLIVPMRQACLYARHWKKMAAPVVAGAATNTRLAIEGL